LHGVKADVCATRRGPQRHAAADPAHHLAAPLGRSVFFGMAEYARGGMPVAQAYGSNRRRGRTRLRLLPHASIFTDAEARTDPEAVAAQ
jgi:hypothetical protein